MKHVFWICIVLVFITCSFQDARAYTMRKDGFKDAPKNENWKGKVKEDLKSVSVGTTKRKLYRVFGAYYKAGYQQDGGEEWITFANNTGDPSGERITFYLKDGRVKAWEIK